MNADELSKLPLSNPNPITKEAADVLVKYFGEDKISPSINWKLVGAIIIAFVLIGSASCAGLLAKLPYCQNVYIVFLLQILVFSLVLLAVMYFFPNK